MDFITIMDIYYDSIDMRYPQEGAVVAGVFTPADTTSFPGVVMDDSFKVTTNFTGSTPKGIRFIAQSKSGTRFGDIDEYFGNIDEYFSDLGDAGIGTAAYLIIHRLSGTPNVEVWSSNSSSTGYVKKFDSTIEDNDWSINAITSSSASYFVVQFTGSHNIDVGEIILAQKISDLHRYQLGFSEGLIPAVKLKGSYGGGEFSNALDNNMEHRSMNYEVNQTYADKLTSLRSGIYNDAKHALFVDGSNRRFGKLTNDIIPVEKAYGYYEIKLDSRSYL